MGSIGIEQQGTAQVLCPPLHEQCEAMFCGSLALQESMLQAAI
jgi:hypothetical protein